MIERDVKITVRAERDGLHPKSHPWRGEVYIDDRPVHDTSSWGRDEAEAQKNAVSLFIGLLKEDE